VSQDSQFRAPAGWYPDPLGLPQLRWWNNHGWTEQVSAAPEPVAVQEARYAWMEDEPPVAAAYADAADRHPTPPQTPSAPSLNQLEGPRAVSKVDEPSMWNGLAVPASPAMPASTSLHGAPQPIAAPQQAQPIEPTAATPPPPPFWDIDDDSRPAPSVLPEDLKFWPGTNPAELRRIAREQAASEFRQ
jgi:hypothetical protein